MTRPFLREERRGAVRLLTMDRSEQRNALSDASQCEASVAAARRINADGTVRTVVLRGVGTAFCTGGNVKHMRSHEGFMAGGPVEVAEGYRRSLQQVALALHELEVPLTAAVNGPAMGAGLDMTCMCDIRIASERARFAETFVRLGIISGIGGAWFLPRIVGQAMAAELSFTGRVIDAEEARRYGLVSEVLPQVALLDRAWVLAGEIAQHSGVALRFCKRLLHMARSGRISTSPLLDTLRSAEAWRSILMGVFGAQGATSVSLYTSVVYMLYFLQGVLHVAPMITNACVAVAVLVAAPCYPLFGTLADRVGRARVMVIGIVLWMLAAYPAFSGIQAAAAAAAWAVVAALVTVLAVLTAMIMAPLPAFIAERFPAQTRATGFGLAQQIGNIVFGGFLPLISLVLVGWTGNQLARVGYSIVSLVPCLVVTYV